MNATLNWSLKTYRDNPEIINKWKKSEDITERAIANKILNDVRSVKE